MYKKNIILLFSLSIVKVSMPNVYDHKFVLGLTTAPIGGCTLLSAKEHNTVVYKKFEPDYKKITFLQTQKISQLRQLYETSMDVSKDSMNDIDNLLIALKKEKERANFFLKMHEADVKFWEKVGLLNGKSKPYPYERFSNSNN